MSSSHHGADYAGGSLGWRVRVGSSTDKPLPTIYGLAGAVAQALGMRDALNLDGGGSTAVVRRRPCLQPAPDATGERAVGDALLILPWAS